VAAFCTAATTSGGGWRMQRSRPTPTSAAAAGECALVPDASGGQASQDDYASQAGSSRRLCRQDLKKLDIRMNEIDPQYRDHVVWKDPIGLLDLDDSLLHAVLVQLGPRYVERDQMDEGEIEQIGSGWWDWDGQEDPGLQERVQSPRVQGAFALVFDEKEAEEERIQPWRAVWNFERTCQRMRLISSTSARVWSMLCAAMWDSKVFVPLQAYERRRQRDHRGAFYFAMQDRTRRRIEANELTAGLWRTRVKKTAGAGALAADPWHRQPSSHTLPPRSAER
jgi:hypothetical protein